MTAGRRTAPQPTGPERADSAPVRPYRPPGVIVVTAESDGLTGGKSRRRGRPGPLALSVVVVLTLAACGGTDAGADPAPEAGQTEPITLYTCLSDESIQPVLAAFQEQRGRWSGRPLPRPHR